MLEMQAGGLEGHPASDDSLVDLWLDPPRLCIALGPVTSATSLVLQLRNGERFTDLFVLEWFGLQN